MHSPLILAGLCLALDSQNLLTPLWHRNVLTLPEESSQDFTIVVPLYGDPRYFENREFLEQYKDNTLLACSLDTPEMISFADRMKAEGWQVSRVYNCESIVEVLQQAVKDVRTTYVIRLDGDSYSTEDFGRAITAMEYDGTDLCSVRVLASNRNNILENLQAVEYAISMRGRSLRPWMTSGACHLARTDSLQRILDNHSLWWVGEDMEVGRLARLFKMRVRHIDFPVYTEVPSIARDLFRQRKLWWAGDFRLTWINLDQNLLYPIFLLYSLVLVWGLLWLKWQSLFSAASALPVVILSYTLIVLLTNWEVRSKWMVLLPYYALIQVTIMPIVGMIEYIHQAARSRSLGLYRVGVFRRAI